MVQHPTIAGWLPLDLQWSIPNFRGAFDHGKLLSDPVKIGKYSW